MSSYSHLSPEVQSEIQRLEGFYQINDKIPAVGYQLFEFLCSSFLESYLLVTPLSVTENVSELNSWKPQLGRNHQNRRK